MRTRLRSEQGWAMVTAIGLMFVMITMGIAAAAIVDAQTKKSARERQDESAFNLAEGVLTTTNYLLTRSWPGGSTTAFAASCTSASVQANCPDPNLLKDDYTGDERLHGHLAASRAVVGPVVRL